MPAKQKTKKNSEVNPQRKETEAQKFARQTEERKARVALGQLKTFEKEERAKPATSLDLKEMQPVFRDVLESKKKLDQTQADIDDIADIGHIPPTDSIHSPEWIKSIPLNGFESIRGIDSRNIETIPLNGLDESLPDIETVPLNDFADTPSQAPFKQGNRFEAILVGTIGSRRENEKIPLNRFGSDPATVETIPLNGLDESPPNIETIPLNRFTEYRNHSPERFGFIYPNSFNPFPRMVSKSPKHSPEPIQISGEVASIPPTDSIHSPEWIKSIPLNGLGKRGPYKEKSLEQEVLSLRGFQEGFFQYVLENIKHGGPLETGWIKISEIASKLGCSGDTTDKNYRILREKKIINYLEHKSGKYGGIRLGVASEVLVYWTKRNAALGEQIKTIPLNGFGSYARAVVVASLREIENPKLNRTDVGANGERSSPSNEDQAIARQPTTTTARERPGALTYQWAHKVAIPVNLRKEGISVLQMQTLEEMTSRNHTLQKTQASVNQFSKALDMGMHFKKVNGKADWKVIPAVFMKAMENPGYFVINGKDNFEENDEMSITPPNPNGYGQGLEKRKQIAKLLID